jgi:hypothetical protein
LGLRLPLTTATAHIPAQLPPLAQPDGCSCGGLLLMVVVVASAGTDGDQPLAAAGGRRAWNLHCAQPLLLLLLPGARA